MWLLILFLLVPLVEIALFIQVGGLLGLWPTLLIVVLTAILGSWLVRSQGSREIQNLRSSFSELKDPTEPLANGAMILFSGALLLTPGFFTDFVGFALLIPPVRKSLYLWLRSRVNVAGFEMGNNGLTPTRNTPQDDIIDGEFQNLETEEGTKSGPSGWTRH